MGPESNARLKKYLKEDQNRPDIPTMDAAKQYLIEYCYFLTICIPFLGGRSNTADSGHKKNLASVILQGLWW